MQITQQTSTILKLQVQKYFQTLFTVLAIGLGFSFTGLIMSVLSNSTTLNCNRLESAQINCEIIRKNWLTQQSRSIPVTDLQSAEVDVRGRTGNNSNRRETYEIILITKNSRIPLTNVYSSGIGFDHYKTNQLLNSFIQASEPNSLTVQHNMRLFAILGVIFVLCGPLLIFSVLKSKMFTHCVFDKELNQLLITKRNIFNSEQEKLMLNQIEQVKVVEGTANSQSSIRLVILEGDNIYLKTFFTSKNQHIRKNYDEIAKSISQFLDIDY